MECVFSVCVELTAGKRNCLTKGLENIPENEQKILRLGLLSIDTDNDTGTYA